MIKNTSLEIYTKLKEYFGKCQIDVYRYINKNPKCTRKEIERDLELQINNVCGRVNELMKCGIVQEVGKVQCKITRNNVNSLATTESINWDDLEIKRRKQKLCNGELLKWNKMEDKKVVWWSGGKDSTAVVLKLIELGEREFDVVFIDTGIEHDEMYKYVEKAIRYFNKFNIKAHSYKSNKYTWEDQFYRIKQKGKNKGDNYGFPYTCGAWCNARLKADPMNEAKKDFKNYTEIIGYAIDEKSRIRQLKIKNKLNGINKFKTVKFVKDKKTKEIREVTLEHDISNERYLLAEYNMKESDCLEICKKHNLYNPLYDLFGRTGCWCCPKQPLSSLRMLRKHYPEKWKQLLLWQLDSKVPFKVNATVQELDKRFELEEQKTSYSKDYTKLEDEE